MVVLVVETQCLSGRAEVVVVLRIVAEVAGVEEAGVAEVEVVGNRDVRPDAGFLQSRYVLAGAVLGVACDLAGMDAPPEDGAPESRSSMGRFSVTSEGVTKTLRTILALPPSTTLWTW